MKIFKVGEINDIYLYAVEDPDYDRYYPLKQSDLEFQQADAKIYYDSGIYPSIAIDELPQYICNKAMSIKLARSQAAVALGSMTSDAKAEAARQNGKRGGRPKKETE